MKYSCLNGKIIKTKKANISMLDKGYWFDFCVYSSLKIIQGEAFALNYHVERLLKSAKIIEIKHEFSKQQIINWVLKIIKKNRLKDCLLRIVLVGDPDDKNPKLYILPITGLTYHKNKNYSQGVKVISYKGQRPVPQAKTKSLLLSFLAFRKAKKEEKDEALMIDLEGNIREGTQTNFYTIKDNYVFTSFKDKSLEGVTKKILKKSLKETKYELKEKDIKISELKQGFYEECFLTSTTRNVLPVIQVDDYRLPSIEKSKEIGKIFKKYNKKESHD